MAAPAAFKLSRHQLLAMGWRACRLSGQGVVSSTSSKSRNFSSSRRIFSMYPGDVKTADRPANRQTRAELVQRSSSPEVRGAFPRQNGIARIGEHAVYHMRFRRRCPSQLVLARRNHRCGKKQNKDRKQSERGCSEPGPVAIGSGLHSGRYRFASNCTN